MAALASPILKVLARIIRDLGFQVTYDEANNTKYIHISDRRLTVSVVDSHVVAMYSMPSPINSNILMPMTYFDIDLADPESLAIFAERIKSFKHPAFRTIAL